MTGPGGKPPAKVPLPASGFGKEEAPELGRTVTVRIVEDPGDGTCRIVDAGGRAVFGGRRFLSAWHAEVYLQEANRRSSWVRWRLRRSARRRRRRRRHRGEQLSLWPDAEALDPGRERRGA
ncbi:MAG: hypothetical protein Kow0092_01800 [Deferrisomatales bacterium]